MSIEKYLENLNHIQVLILKFIDEVNNCDDNLQNIVQFLEEQKILTQKNEIKLILHFLNEISINHYRTPNFFSKIEQILSIFSTEMQNLFTKKEIFEVFQNSKRILLFLLNEKIIDSESYFTRKNYGVDFSFYLNISGGIKFTEENEENRKIGENKNLICKLIRNDSIEDFIIFINQNNISFDSLIPSDSTYETNQLFIEKDPSLIEYAAFFGSIQIFKYLHNYIHELPNSLWIYSIHSNNPEMINLLEENNISMNLDECIEEIIKCHHNEILEYFENNHSLSTIRNKRIVLLKIKYYNFMLSKDEIIDIYSFNSFCMYDYADLVNFLIKINDINLNQMI